MIYTNLKQLLKTKESSTISRTSLANFGKIPATPSDENTKKGKIRSNRPTCRKFMRTVLDRMVFCKTQEFRMPYTVLMRPLMVTKDPGSI